MSVQFSQLPQIEFPDNVKNKYAIRVHLLLGTHLCFLFMCSMVYSIVPFVYIFNPYLMLGFGLFSAVLSRYTQACRDVLVGVYIFCTGYALGYIVPHLYLELCLDSLLFSYMCIVLFLHVMKERHVYLPLMAVCNGVLSLSLFNTILYFYGEDTNIWWSVGLNVCMIVYIIKVYYSMNQSTNVYTPTQFYEGFLLCIFTF